MSALDEYLNRNEEWRRENNETQLLQSHIQRYKQVVPPTISGRIQNALKSFGINVLLFAVHPTHLIARLYKQAIVPIHLESFQNSVIGRTIWHHEQSKETWALVKWSAGSKTAVLYQTGNLQNKILEFS